MEHETRTSGQEPHAAAKAATPAPLDARALSGTLELQAILDLHTHDLDPGDFEFMRSLTSDQKQQVLRRLHALLRNEAGLPVGEASRIAGVTGPNFYRMRRLWAGRGETGLSFLGGYAGRPPREAPRIPSSGDWVYKHLRRRNVQHIVGFSVKDVAKLIQARSATRIPGHVLNHGARYLRQDIRNDPGVFPEIYGSRILIDYSAVSVVVGDEDGSTRLVEVAWVIEEASQLILAAYPALGTSPCDAQRRAVRAAHEYVQSYGLDVPSEPTARIEAVVPDPSSAQDKHYIDRLISTLGEKSVAITGVRRFGRFVLDVVGPVLGRIKIIPRATLTQDTSAAHVRAFGRGAFDEASAIAIIHGAVQAHNQPIVDRLGSLDLPFCQRDDGRGRMASALAALLELPI